MLEGNRLPRHSVYFAYWNWWGNHVLQVSDTENELTDTTDVAGQSLTYTESPTYSFTLWAKDSRTARKNETVSTGSIRYSSKFATIKETLNYFSTRHFECDFIVDE